MLSSEANVIIWDEMLSSEANVIIWDKMLSSVANVMQLHTGADHFGKVIKRGII